VKILHVCPRYWPAIGGAERYIQELSERLVRDGHEVTVFTTDAYDLELFWKPGFRRVPVLEDEHNGVRIRRFRVRHVPFHLPVSLVATLGVSILPSRELDLLLHHPSPLVPDLLRASAHGFDVVHTSSLPYSSILYAGYRQARTAGARLICTPHAHIGYAGSKWTGRMYSRSAQMRLLGQSDVVVARTQREATYLCEHGLPRDRLRVIGCGINPQELEGGDGRRFRARHGLSPDEPIIFYMGMKAFNKGTRHLVEAMRLLWSKGCSARLVLAGSSQPDFRRFWRDQPQSVRDRTVLLDFISDEEKRDLFAAGQVFAMPSRSDTFGIVYLEAWAYGLPVIGAYAGGVPDVITHDEDGLLVPFGDVPALAASIERLISDPVLRYRLGSRGRSMTLSRWTWDVLFRDIRPLYIP
jgi:glycosyltransferase involved in cell wall biosynthesis